MTITPEWIARRPGGRPPSAAAVSVRSGAGSENLLPLVLAQAAPDAVRLVDLQRVLAAFQQGGTTRADRLGLRLAAGPCRASFAFRMEEVRAGHAPTCGVELPVPQVGIRSRKTPGIGHRISLLDLGHPAPTHRARTDLGQGARWHPRAEGPTRTVASRDAESVVGLTIERAASMIKSEPARYAAGHCRGWRGRTDSR